MNESLNATTSASYELLTEEHFLAVLNRVRDQVLSGKGRERHGHENKLADQPWVAITNNVGDGFLIGQALKKLMELRSFPMHHQHGAWMREALGAIGYIAFAIMNKEQKHEGYTHE